MGTFLAERFKRLMMIEDNLKEKLAAYLDGTLEASERSGIAELLKKSSRHRKELKALKKALALTRVDAVPVFKPIKWTLPSVKPATWWRWVLAPAAVALVIGGFVTFGGLDIFQSHEQDQWVMVGADTLSYDEGYQLINMIFTQDGDLKEGLVKYTETMAPDIYTDLVGLEKKEAEVLIFLLEEKIADLERS